MGLSLNSAVPLDMFVNTESSMHASCVPGHKLLTNSRESWFSQESPAETLY